jgi:hypothetical protein
MDCAAVRSSLELLRINGLTQDPYDWLVRQGAILDLLAPQEKVLDAPKTLAAANRMLPISTYDNLDHMERKLFVAIESIRAKVGILSLSERYDSLPMWARYADQAKGFVVILRGPGAQLQRRRYRKPQWSKACRVHGAVHRDDRSVHSRSALLLETFRLVLRA